MFSIFGNKKSPQGAASPPDAVAEPAACAQLTPEENSGWLTRLKSGLFKTRELLNTDVSDLFSRHAKVDESLYLELESALISADVGIRSTTRLIEQLRQVSKAKQIADGATLQAEFKALLIDLISPLEKPLNARLQKPFVIMVAGVNGAGKTTTIGKLAKYFQSQQLTVMLAAGDTFRAAAREQLITWGERNGVAVMAPTQGDSAAVIYDAIQSAQARKIDVVLADTAGRLATQLHLMAEIQKVKRVISKACAGAPHEILLVLDANNGQNALAQVKAFDDALQLTGLVVTKLDGTAKGGMIAALASDRPERVIPVRFIGVGEAIDDLRPFSAREFVNALF